MWPFRKKHCPNAFSPIDPSWPLVRETRWWREYKSPDDGTLFFDSRFRDGSASINLDALTREWPSWNQHERLDFSLAFCHCQCDDRSAILRFLMRNADHDVSSTIASSIALALPTEESLPFLQKCCTSCDVGRGANYFQALWMTRSPKALPILKASLDRIWNSPDLQKTDEFCNFTAFDAIWCIDALVRVGTPVASLRDRYETLLSHPTMQGQTIQWLSTHFEE